MKNHRVVSQINTIEELFKVLHLEKSIYFAPINRVMPTKFFLGDSWRYGALQRHLGNFFQCEKKSDYFARQQRRIGASMFNAQKIAEHLIFSSGSKIKYSKNGIPSDIKAGPPDLVCFNVGL